MKIFKYRAPVLDEGHVVMPVGAKILTVQVQHVWGPEDDEVPFFWALVDPSQPLHDHKYSVRGTGHPADDLGPYIGTIQPSNGLVFHYFDRKES
jgi:hypothetical protein